MLTAELTRKIVYSEIALSKRKAIKTEDGLEDYIGK